MQDSFSGIFGTLFLFQAITNSGCCGSNGCTKPNSTNDNSKTKDIEFEEVKTK